MIDDGELGRVRHVLHEFGVQVDHLSGEWIADHVEGPYELLVTSVKRATALAESVDPSALGKPVWVVFHSQDFLPLRERMRRLGVHFLIHSSVDDDALRLLLLHALYQGPEKRDAPRLPVGSHVLYRDGTNTGAVELLDLTAEGCRLLAPHDAEPGREITITLPPVLARGRAFALPGRVVRVERATEDPEHHRRISVAFGPLDRESRRRLEAIFAGKVIGTAVTPLAEDDRGEADRQRFERDAIESEPVESDAIESEAIELEDIERRRKPRTSYAGNVTALTGEASHVILGRDLSPEGMRVEPLPDLRVGTAIRLALYGAPREEPLLVRAVVTRDDGERGTVLRFQESDPALRARIERLVAAATAIESLGDSVTGERPVVVSRAVVRDGESADA
jgi:hypothetical protein